MDMNLRSISWVGSSLDDLKSLPKNTQREIGFTLHQIQEGVTPDNVKPLTSVGPGIYEIICSYNKNSYRAVYALKIGDEIYVLHVFQKKSKTGKAIPKEHLDLIAKRYNIAKRQTR